MGVTDENDDSKEREIVDKINPEIRSQVESITKEYKKLLEGLFMMLNCQTQTNLNFLVFRLDFNEFYKNSKGTVIGKNIKMATQTKELKPDHAQHTVKQTSKVSLKRNTRKVKPDLK